MTRTLKMLGVAVMALLALGAVAASGASAAEEFHSEKSTTILTGDNVGEGNHVFTAADGSQVICQEATFRGTGVGLTSTTQTVHPTYNKCTFAGFPASVDTTGCNYEFSSKTNATGHLITSIECTSGREIKVTTSFGCTLLFGPQVTNGGTKVTNLGVGASRDVTVHATTKATFTPVGFCPEGVGTVGEYTGTATLKGFVDNGVKGNIDEVNAKGEDETTVYTEGAQVGIWWE